MADSQETEPKRVAIGGTSVVPTQPDELVYPLRRETFDILCEGEATNENQRCRDLSISVCATSLFGLIALFANADPKNLNFKDSPWGFSLLLISGTVFLASGTLSIFFGRRSFKNPASSSYARAKKRILDFFSTDNQKNSP